MALAAFGVGIVVGLTGMGGAALMTPMLVLLFGVAPLAAVSSDLVASAVMKPVGSIVHLRRRTVRLDVVRWLSLGSVPAAFAGALVAHALGPMGRAEQLIRWALGAALVIAAGGLLVRAYLRLAERGRRRDGHPGLVAPDVPTAEVRRPATVLVGALGGLLVGLTSVGSGSLIIIALMGLYPGLRTSELVGTDLVQAVPLVLSAAAGHLLFGDFRLSLTLPLLAGSVPGAWIGAQLSSRLPGGVVQRALALVLTASALKLFGLSAVATGAVLALLGLAAQPAWMLLRWHHGFPARPRRHRVARAGR